MLHRDAVRDHGEQQHHLCVWRVQRCSGMSSNKAWRDSQQLCECQQWLNSHELKKEQGLGNATAAATKHMDKATDPSAGGWGLFLRDKPPEKQPGTAAGRSRSRECDGQELPLPKAGGFGQSRERQQSCCDFINFTFSRVCSSPHHLRRQQKWKRSKELQQIVSIIHEKRLKRLRAILF